MKTAMFSGTVGASIASVHGDAEAARHTYPGP